MDDMLSCLQDLTTARVEVFYKDQMRSMVVNLNISVEDLIKMITGCSDTKAFEIKFSDGWTLHQKSSLQSQGVKHNDQLYLFDEPQG